ncbi:hypothetical protein Daura_18300 [Dactylosporangium aurantiacum]|uniref:Uncharacterized protein n=1 Tax=Dactylosporangium aurantiacum TaxID=35754 RepID=A0A9Q9IKQ3_9ACTN|nr:hypothetical protein [Dactylosporangium aurantiacum]MDG6105878.1 hypothetical protein [Dactylosporangium aurantiacum]UWZ57947.1 hypothetical protein Daura_18300 [Dactylosporangium aurantiacum]
MRDLLDVVHRNSTHLRGIVDDLLDVAALDSGHTPLDVGTVTVAARPGGGTRAEVRLPVTGHD